MYARSRPSWLHDAHVMASIDDVGKTNRSNDTNHKSPSNVILHARAIARLVSRRRLLQPQKCEGKLRRISNLIRSWATEKRSSKKEQQDALTMRLAAMIGSALSLRQSGLRIPPFCSATRRNQIQSLYMAGRTFMRAFIIRLIADIELRITPCAFIFPILAVK